MTKEIEDQLVQQSKEKVFECLRTSNQIHQILEENQIDRVDMMENLYSEPLFRYQVAIFFFKSKMVVKKRLEDFVIQRI